MSPLTVVRLEGLSPYTAVHHLQERLVDLRRAEALGDVLLLLEHPETITVGRRKEGMAGVVAPGPVPVVPIERGGEATWHGPGQLVGYPIVALDGPRRDVHRYLDALVQGVVDLLAELGLSAGRDPRNTGTWIDGRKVCSVGIAIRQWVAWHGFALNVDAALDGFARIRPCGFDADVMTRLADHLDPCPSVEALVVPIAGHVAGSLGTPWDGRVHRARVADTSDADGLVDRLVTLASAVPSADVDPLTGAS
ncbi:MAG: lipoyl(octanoyl) transferase LipB [Alphaproteobacteria bacterium]|nr:lipoyl(octanoyl) transferase LipB [Alphaproteobacteria bacterium]